MKSLIGSLAILIILMPWLTKSIADRSIDVNGLLLNLLETVTEIVTRTPQDWDSPAPTQQPHQGGEPRL